MENNANDPPCAQSSDDNNLEEESKIILHRLVISTESSYRLFKFAFNNFPVGHAARETINSHTAEAVALLVDLNYAKGQSKTHYQNNLEMWKSDAFRFANVVNILLEDLQKLGPGRFQNDEDNLASQQEYEDNTNFGENLSTSVFFGSSEAPLGHVENCVTDV